MAVLYQVFVMVAPNLFIGDISSPSRYNRCKLIVTFSMDLAMCVFWSLDWVRRRCNVRFVFFSSPSKWNRRSFTDLLVLLNFGLPLTVQTSYTSLQIPTSSKNCKVTLYVSFLPPHTHRHEAPWKDRCHQPSMGWRSIGDLQLSLENDRKFWTIGWG